MPRWILLIAWFGPWSLCLTAVSPEARGQTLEKKGEQSIPREFHVVEGRHVRLVTDLPPSPALAELPIVFDHAVAAWAAFFEIPADTCRSWHLTGYLIGSEDRFRRAGLWPADLPPFAHGYQRANEMWVREQPSDYYRRHLWLHEGTHGFMHRFLGGVGPVWFAEGVAEYLATHSWNESQLKLGILPARKDDVPYWGRIKRIRDEIQARGRSEIDQILALPPSSFGDVDAYAWSWALVTLLAENPSYQPGFRRALRQLDGTRFTDDGAWLVAARQQSISLDEAWDIFCRELDYGADVAADQIIPAPTRPAQDGQRYQVRTEAGWQSTGWQLQAGTRYRVTTTGRYELRDALPAWPSEAGGVTLRYEQGLPLGVLLGALREEPDASPARWAPTVPLGLSATLQPERDGVLFVRINERGGERADNRGVLIISLEVDKTR